MSSSDNLGQNLGYLSKVLACSDSDNLWNNLKNFWSPVRGYQQVRSFTKSSLHDDRVDVAVID